MGLLKSFQLAVFNKLQSSVFSLRSISLKTKTKASSLIEVIVATVIIIIIFAIITLTLNNIIKNTYRAKTNNINNHLNKIVYLYSYGKIKTPFQENYKDWEIQANNEKQNNINYLVFTATHKKTKKEISKRVLNED